MKQRPSNPMVVPSILAKTALGFSRDPNKGQSSGPPGMGPEPFLAHEPGGDVVDKLLHPAFEMYEELYRALPEESWFDPNVSPQRPVTFELGAFTVPPDQNLWIFDYEFAVFRQSGVDPGDSIRAEEGRFSGVMGFDITISGKRVSHLLFQLDPVPVQFQRQTFDVPPGVIGQRANPAQFNRSSAQSFAANSSSALSLLPVRPNRFGPRNGPFTIIAGQGSKVALSVVIFKPVTTPITSIEGSSRGYLIHGQVSSSIINRMRPR